MEGVSICSQLVQNIGNLCLELDAKEMYMSPMAHILPTAVRRLKEFIQSLVQIDQKDGECEDISFPFLVLFQPASLHMYVHVMSCDMCDVT